MGKVEIGQTYQHFKGHYIVEIITIALDSETKERMVVYKHTCDDVIWVRPEKMFLEEIPERPDNVAGQKHRFELIS